MRPSPWCQALRGGSHPAHTALLRLLPAGCPPRCASRRCVKCIAATGAWETQLQALPLRAAAVPGLDQALPPRRAAAALAAPQTLPARSSCTFASSHLLGFVQTVSPCPGASAESPHGPPRAAGWGRREVCPPAEAVKPLESLTSLSGVICGGGRTTTPWAPAKPKGIFTDTIKI